jgi:hypothetical protein
MSLYAILGREDPVPWLLASDEPQARWVTLARLTDAPDPDRLAEAHAEVLAHPATVALLDMLPEWETPAEASGHNKPELATNLLDLLAEIGVTADDDERIPRLLEQMLSHTDDDGRFLAFASQRSGPPVWGTVFCDTHAVADIAGRFGLAGDPRVQRARSAAAADLAETDMGPAWFCREDPATGFRGPGRKSEPCPQATLEALRAFSWLPESDRPEWITTAAHTLLGIWRQRGERKPYMMGHGRQFKTVKWPPTWYGAFEVIDVLGRIPETWRASEEDRRSVTEIAACLLAYNVAADGRVTPQSVFRGWEVLSLGQKKSPSPLATAMLWSRLASIDWLAEEIAAVDVTRLGSSKGGTGTPMPPKV